MQCKILYVNKCHYWRSYWEVCGVAFSTKLTVFDEWLGAWVIATVILISLKLMWLHLTLQSDSSFVYVSGKAPSLIKVDMLSGAMVFPLCLFLLTGLELNLWVTWQLSYPPWIWVISPFRWRNVSFKNWLLKLSLTCAPLTNPFLLNPQERND